MHVHAGAAAIDLAGAQMDQLAGDEGQGVVLLGRLVEGVQCLHGLWQDHDGVLHPGLHDRSPNRLMLVLKVEVDGDRIARIDAIANPKRLREIDLASLTD